MDLKELRQIVREMRKLGVKALTTDALSLTLTDIAPSHQRLKRQGKESNIEGKEIPVEVENGYSEDDALFWSVGN